MAEPAPTVGAVSVSFSGKFSILITPMPSVSQQEKVWDGVTELVGPNHIVLVQAAKDGSAMEFKVDLASGKLSVERLVQIFPGATLTSKGSEHLVVRL